MSLKIFTARNLFVQTNFLDFQSPKKTLYFQHLLKSKSWMHLTQILKYLRGLNCVKFCLKGAYLTKILKYLRGHIWAKCWNGSWRGFDGPTSKKSVIATFAWLATKARITTSQMCPLKQLCAPRHGGRGGRGNKNNGPGRGGSPNHLMLWGVICLFYYPVLSTFVWFAFNYNASLRAKSVECVCLCVFVQNIARIAKAALHKLPWKSSLNVSFVFLSCPVCPVFFIFLLLF